MVGIDKTNITKIDKISLWHAYITKKKELEKAEAEVQKLREFIKSIMNAVEPHKETNDVCRAIYTQAYFELHYDELMYGG